LPDSISVDTIEYAVRCADVAYIQAIEDANKYLKNGGCDLLGELSKRLISQVRREKTYEDIPDL